MEQSRALGGDFGVELAFTQCIDAEQWHLSILLLFAIALVHQLVCDLQQSMIGKASLEARLSRSPYKKVSAPALDLQAPKPPKAAELGLGGAPTCSRQEAPAWASPQEHILNR